MTIPSLVLAGEVLEDMEDALKPIELLSGNELLAAKWPIFLLSDLSFMNRISIDALHVDVNDVLLPNGAQNVGIS